MARSLKGVWLAALCLLLVSCGQPGQASYAPQAVDGVIDLRGWDFERDGITNLSGEWAFFWQELIPPSQMDELVDFQFVPVPDSWTGYLVDGKNLPVEGYATYRLIVHLPDTYQSYGLYLEGQGTAYTLWVDGKLISQNGRVADNPEEMIPKSKPRSIFFETEGDSTEFVIQISNFNHRKAGFRNRILIGLPSQIHEYQQSGVALDASIISIFLVMSIYHFFIFLFRRNNKSTLYFALISLMSAVRKGLLDYKLLILLFPGLNWDMALRIEYFTFYINLPLFALFIESLYPREFNQWFLRFSIAAGGGFSLLLFGASTLVLGNTITPFQGIILVGIGYLVYFFSKIILNRNEDAIYIGIAGLILFIGVVLEILSLQNVISIRFNGTITFLAFVLVQAILLSSRLSKSFKRVEALSSELEEANLSLLESELKYRNIFEDTKDMIFIADLEERILDVNPAGERLLGYEWTDMIGMKLTDLLMNPKERELIEKSLHGASLLQDVELGLKKKDGDLIYGLVTLSLRKDDDGNITGIHGHIHDLTPRKQIELEKMRAATFEQLSMTDPLTKVYNRRFFDEVAIKAWEHAKRSKSAFSICIFDIDHFKKINDTYGHPIGDQILMNLAYICLSNMRNMDIFARFGGEEFVILMPDASAVSAFGSVERLRKVIESTSLATVTGQKLHITISAGIAGARPDDPEEIRVLINRADQALYISKQAGRNQTTIWEKY